MYLIKMTQGIHKFYWDGIKWNSLQKLALPIATESRALAMLRKIRRFDKISGNNIRFEVIKK